MRGSLHALAERHPRADVRAVLTFDAEGRFRGSFAAALTRGLPIPENAAEARRDGGAKREAAAP